MVDREGLARGLQILEAKGESFKELVSFYEHGFTDLKINVAAEIDVHLGIADTFGYSDKSVEGAFGCTLFRLLLQLQRAQVHRYELSEAEIEAVREEFRSLDFPFGAFETLLCELDEIAARMQQSLFGSWTFRVCPLLDSVEFKVEGVREGLATGDLRYGSAWLTVYRAAEGGLSFLDALEKVIGQARKHLDQHGSDNLREISPGDQGDGLTLTETGGFVWEDISYDPASGVPAFSRIEIGDIQYVARLSTSMLVLPDGRQFVYVGREKRWCQLNPSS